MADEMQEPQEQFCDIDIIPPKRITYGMNRLIATVSEDYETRMKKAKLPVDLLMQNFLAGMALIEAGHFTLVASVNGVSVDLPQRLMDALESVKRGDFEAYPEVVGFVINKAFLPVLNAVNAPLPKSLLRL